MMSPRAEMFRSIISGPWDGSNPLGPGICQFTVVFRKVDNTMRTMKCLKKPPKKDRVFKGGGAITRQPYKKVWDVGKKAWRTINFETMVEYKCGKDLIHA